MKASDVMAPRVIVVQEGASVEEAARLMLQEGITGLPVIDRDGDLVGIVTEGDFLRRPEDGVQLRWLEVMINPARLALDCQRAHLRRVSEVMTRHVITVREDDDVERIAAIMEIRDISRVVVLRGKTVVGIIGRGNLVHAISIGSLDEMSDKASDLAIRREIVSDLKALAWAPSASVNPIVWDGVVHLHGCVRHERERAALAFIARCVPGVVAVEDHLVLVEPYQGMTSRRNAA